MIAVDFHSGDLGLWFLKAPLEQACPPAPKRRTRARRPWYFPRLAGNARLFRSLDGRYRFARSRSSAGLVAIPYLDFNKKGSGYFTFNERPFAISMFLIGFRRHVGGRLSCWARSYEVRIGTSSDPTSIGDTHKVLAAQ